MEIKGMSGLIGAFVAVTFMGPAGGSAQNAAPQAAQSKDASQAAPQAESSNAASSEAAQPVVAPPELKFKELRVSQVQVPQGQTCWGLDFSDFECMGVSEDLNGDTRPELIVIDNNCGAYGCETILRIFHDGPNGWSEMNLTTDSGDGEEDTNTTTGNKNVVKVGRKLVKGWLEVCASVGAMEAEHCFAWDGTGWVLADPIVKLAAIAVEPGVGMGGCLVGSAESVGSLPCNDQRLQVIIDSGKPVGIVTRNAEVIKSAGFKKMTIAEARKLYPRGKKICGVEVESLEHVLEPWDPDLDCRNVFEGWSDPAAGIALLKAYDWSGMSKYCEPGEWGVKLVVFPKSGTMPVGTPTACRKSPKPKH